MNTIIPIATLRANLSDAVETVAGKKDYLLIQKRNRITSAIVDIDLFEDLLAATDHAYLESIRQARSEHRAGKLLTHDQVFGAL